MCLNLILGNCFETAVYDVGFRVREHLFGSGGISAFLALIFGGSSSPQEKTLHKDAVAVPDDGVMEHTLSGIAQLDFALHGEPFCTDGRVSVYTRDRVRSAGHATLKWADVEDLLELCADLSALKRSANLVLMFSGCALSTTDVYDQISALTVGIDCKICVGVCGSEGTLVYIRKNDRSRGSRWSSRTRLVLQLFRRSIASISMV